MAPVNRVPAMGWSVPAPNAKRSVCQEFEGGKQSRSSWLGVRQGEERPRSWQAGPLLSLDPGRQGGEVTRAHIGVGQLKVREALVVLVALPVQPGGEISIDTDVVFFHNTHSILSF